MLNCVVVSMPTDAFSPESGLTYIDECPGHNENLKFAPNIDMGRVLEVQLIT